MDNNILLKIELPKGWAKATISEMISADGVFVDGDWVESKDQDPNGEVRLIQLADIGDGEFRDKSNRFLTFKRANQIGCTFLLVGDILVARMPDPIGRACLFTLNGANKFVTVVDVAIIRPGKDSINGKLLHYFINSPIIRNKIDALQSGTTRKRISRGNLSLIEFPVPPLNEQNRIVIKLDELLSELEKGKDLLQTSLKQLKVYKQSILKYAFEGKLRQERNYSNHESSQELLVKIANDKLEQFEKDVLKAKKLKKSKPQKIFFPDLLINHELFELPKSWRWSTIFSISGQENNAIVDGPFGSNLKISDYIEKGEFPVISITNIDEGFSAHQVRYISNKKFEELKRSSVNGGDILVAKIGSSYGKVGIYPENMKAGIIPANLLKVTVSPRVNKQYIIYYLKSGYFKKHIDRITKSTAQPAFNVSMFRALPIPIPPREVQDIIVNELDSIFSNSENIQKIIHQNLSDSEALRRSLLQKAFEGNLIEQDSRDESAKILLERIQKKREEFLQSEKERKKKEKPLHIKNRKMAEELKQIIEILKESKKPVLAKSLWQSSVHKNDIDEFYRTLKRHIEDGEIEEVLPRIGKESFLKLLKTK